MNQTSLTREKLPLISADIKVLSVIRLVLLFKKLPMPYHQQEEIVIPT